MNGEWKGTDKFLSSIPIQGTFNSVNKIQEVNSLVLYSLTPGGVSRFKDIQVCFERCPGAEDLTFNQAAALAAAAATLLSISSLYL